MSGKYHSIFVGKWIVCLLLLFFCNLTYAQETIVRYIKKGGYTEHRDSADYIRVVDISANEQGLHTLNEYYPNGSLKRHGTLQTTDLRRLIFEGLVESYFPNGNVESILKYSDNHLIDTAQWFYKNGVLKTKKVYYRKNSDLPDGVNSLLIYHADSTGNIQVQDGNGQAQFINANTEIEQGAYSDGLRVGKWEGSFQKGKYRFEEYYENGKLIQGISTDSLGNEYPYSQIYIQPDYPEGIQSFGQFIVRNFNYPEEAIQANISGQLQISFVINTTGRPVEIEAVNDLGYGTAEEAVAAINRSANWSPGYMRGVPVRVKFIIPIVLKYD